MNHTITITLPLTPENLEKVKVLCPDIPLETAPTPVLTPAPAIEAASAPQAVQQEETPKPETKITKTDVRAVALKLSKSGKKDELAAIFEKFGAKKLSDFEAMPEKYPDLMRELSRVENDG